tara:strand:- start:364 stop:690 length:327 start_codon:yes stop_codon:yes gene_type:complete
MNLNQIKEAVEEHLQIKLSSRTRDREHSDARALYYKLSREFTHHTLHTIGKEVDRDHSSVLHGLNNIFMHVDQDLYDQLKIDLQTPRKYFTNITRARRDNIIVTNKKY